MQHLFNPLESKRLFDNKYENMPSFIINNIHDNKVETYLKRDIETEDILLDGNSVVNEDNLFLSIFKENNQNNQNLKEEKLNQMNLIDSSGKNGKELIFSIKKEKLGIKRKRNKNSNVKRKHTREAYDNIISKITNRIINGLITFINKLIKKLKNSELRKLSLVNIDKKNIPISNKKNKLRLLNMKLKQILSGNISKKYKKLEKKYSNYKKYNKIYINIFYENKEKDLINIFEKSFKDIIEIYNGNNKKCGIFDEFITLKDDIIELELKEKENYVNSYKYVAENFINIIEEIEERNPTKDKIIK